MTVDTGWEESDSERFIRFGDILTPSRGEQLQMLVDLLPASSDEEFTAVDLGTGAGPLTGAILQAYPHSHVVAMDGSPAMLDTVRARFRSVGDRLTTVHGDLRRRDWFQALPGTVRVMVSSLAIHHLDGAEKAALYRDCVARLDPEGALLFIDLVEPINERAARAYGSAWERAVVAQSREKNAPDALAFFEDGWNYYITPDRELDKPSRLEDNLRWLRDAGLKEVDCFWLQAGHALYGGYL